MCYSTTNVQRAMSAPRLCRYLTTRGAATRATAQRHRPGWTSNSPCPASGTVSKLSTPWQLTGSMLTDKLSHLGGLTQCSPFVFFLSFLLVRDRDGLMSAIFNPSLLHFRCFSPPYLPDLSAHAPDTDLHLKECRIDLVHTSYHVATNKAVCHLTCPIQQSW